MIDSKAELDTNVHRWWMKWWAFFVDNRERKAQQHYRFWDNIFVLKSYRCPAALWGVIELLVLIWLSLFLLEAMFSLHHPVSKEHHPELRAAEKQALCLSSFPSYGPRVQNGQMDSIMGRSSLFREKQNMQGGPKCVMTHESHDYLGTYRRVQKKVLFVRHKTGTQPVANFLHNPFLNIFRVLPVSVRPQWETWPVNV